MLNTDFSMGQSFCVKISKGGLHLQVIFRFEITFRTLKFEDLIATIQSTSDEIGNLESRVPRET